MSQYAIWLDRQNAKIFKMGAVSKELELHWTPPSHHTHGHDGSAQTSEKFYHEIATQLHNATGILILGPGVAPKQLKHHFDQHHPKLAERVLAVESSDHPTDNQLKALANEFFINPLHAV